MSVVKMSKLRLIGLNSERAKLLDELYVLSCAHIKDVEHIEGTKLGDNAELETALKKASEEVEKVIEEEVEKVVEEEVEEKAEAVEQVAEE